MDAKPREPGDGTFCKWRRDDVLEEIFAHPEGISKSELRERIKGRTSFAALRNKPKASLKKAVRRAWMHHLGQGRVWTRFGLVFPKGTRLDTSGDSGATADEDAGSEVA